MQHFLLQDNLIYHNVSWAQFVRNIIYSQYCTVAGEVWPEIARSGDSEVSCGTKALKISLVEVNPYRTNVKNRVSS